jgi:HlyD family secretion protein
MGRGNVLNGRVRRVEPSGFMKVSALGVEEQRVNVIVDFANRAEAGSLGDAYRVEVRIVTWRVDSTLKVNVGSLFRRGEDWAVFAIENGRARLQPVKVGQRNDREGQILEGLSEGQMVALHPPDTLQDGARIKRRGQTP